MTILTKKESRRYRVQFTMSRQLYEFYQEIQGQAKKHHVIIDFGAEFAMWFRNQLDQAGNELCELVERQEHVPPNQLHEGIDRSPVDLDFLVDYNLTSIESTEK